MSGIVPYEDDGLRKPYSAGDALSFLEYLYKKGRLIKVLLYVVTSLIFLLMYAYTVQYTLGTEFGSFSSGLIAFAFIVFLGFVFAFRQYPGNTVTSSKVNSGRIFWKTSLVSSLMRQLQRPWNLLRSSSLPSVC